MVTVWRSTADVIHYNFRQLGQTITAESDCEEIDEMYPKLRQQQTALVNRRGPILLHDNARPHVSQITKTKFKRIGRRSSASLTILSRPLANRRHFHLFKHFDNFLTGRILSIRTRVKRPSSTSSNPEHPISLPTE